MKKKAPRGLPAVILFNAPTLVKGRAAPTLI